MNFTSFSWVKEVSKILNPVHVNRLWNLSLSTTLDYSRFPKLNEKDIEETFVRGSGPGGQAVNKTSNCVMLRHKPTNIVIKCHTHRIASRNRIEARKLLLEKLDVLLNGKYSIEAQTKAIEDRKSAEKTRRQKKLQQLKKNWKERENLEYNNIDQDSK